jgi:hypothetical protein
MINLTSFQTCSCLTCNLGALNGSHYRKTQIPESMSILGINKNSHFQGLFLLPDLL